MRTAQDWEDPDESEIDDEDSADDSELMPCPYCREMIYEDAERCPECGKYISEEDGGEARQPAWVWITVLICVLLIVLFWILS
jgi:hypothetical protein